MMIKYVAAVLGLVIVIGGGYLLLSGTSAPENTGERMEDESAMMQEEGSFSGSLQALAERGGNYKCTIVHDSAVALSSGVVYIAGKNVRGDFESKTQGITVESHMIVKDGSIYTWTPIAPTGFKLKAVESAASQGDAAMQGAHADLQQSYNYNCEAWSVDASKFTVPNIPFTEIN